jgi:DNA-3-methyladenine glycosylase II
MGFEGKPSEKRLREIAEDWRPYRGAAAILAWHSYNSSVL